MMKILGQKITTTAWWVKVLLIIAADIWWQLVWSVDVRIPAIVDVSVKTLILVLAVYVLASRANIRASLAKDPSNLESTVTIVQILALLVAILTGALMWNYQMGLHDSDIPDEYRRNVYITQTINPPYYRTHKYSLLIECGVTKYDSPLNVVLSIGTVWASSDAWWDEPMSTTRTAQAIRPFNMPIVKDIGGGLKVTTQVTNVSENTTPPIIRLSFQGVLVAPERSFYIYLEGDRPLNLTSAKFGETKFDIKGTKIITSNKR